MGDTDCDFGECLDREHCRMGGTCGQITEAERALYLADPTGSADDPLPAHWRPITTRYGWPGVVGSATPGGPPLVRFGLGDSLPNQTQESAQRLADVLNAGVRALGGGSGV